MNRTIISVSCIALLLAGATIPLGHAQDIPMTPLAEVSLGFPYSESFDDDDGNWTANPPEPATRQPPVSSWEWGAPTSGPDAAFSGNNVWATNLDGKYGASECAGLLSPPIDLTGASTAEVSFMQWRHLDQSAFGSKFINDGGLLFVTADGGETLTIVNPLTGYDGPLGSVPRRCLDAQPSPTQGIGGPPGSSEPGPTYSPIAANLSAYAGSVVQFVIAYGTSSATHRAGWYIDDFTVTIDGISTVEDFETSDGGFQVVSTYAVPDQAQGWSWGHPDAGPDHDSNLWATNPAGDYGDLECAWAESPLIDLTDVPTPAGEAGAVSALLRWDQWFRANSLYAAGILQVGIDGTYHYVVPDGGYPGTATGTYEDQLQGCLGAEAGEGAYSGTYDSSGDAMEGATADLSAFLGNEITLRFFFASAWSPLNPSRHPGWYVDNVEIELRIVVMGPDVEQLVGDLVPTPDAPVQFPGWTTGGEESSWSYGVASKVGPEGEVAYATGIAGNYNRNECSWIESPPIPGALIAADPTLRFSHWYHQYFSSSSGTAWNGGAIFVSTDAGATWEYVNTPAYTSNGGFSGLRNCLRSIDADAPSSPDVFSAEQDFFTDEEVDLSDYADAATLQIRFVQGVGINIGRPGWYLQEISVGGVPLTT